MTSAPILIVIRGNSATGKTTTAREARRRYGRGASVLEQDLLRRIVLREHDTSRIDPIAPAFIANAAGFLLSSGYHVIIEGILHTARYRDALRRLIADHPGPSHVYYLDVSFAETVRRHHRRAEPIPVTPAQMAEWYAPQDLLGTAGELLIPESSTLDQTVTTILNTSGLISAAPLTPCPIRCPHCADEQTAVSLAVGQSSHNPSGPQGRADSGDTTAVDAAPTGADPSDAANANGRRSHDPGE
jgi:predicted kinase